MLLAGVYLVPPDNLVQQVHELGLGAVHRGHGAQRAVVLILYKEALLAQQLLIAAACVCRTRRCYRCVFLPRCRTFT